MRLLHKLAALALLTCVVLGTWQVRTTGSTTMAVGYVLALVVVDTYVLYVWWKLIHQKKVPFDKDWAVKARAKAEAGGIHLNEIPGWATDKSLRRAVSAASREHPQTLALPFGRKAHALESLDQKARATQSTPKIAENSTVERDQLDVEANDGSDDETDPTIQVRAISSTVVVDEELDAYNRYLFELSQEDRPTHWRKSS
jgi:hypothetical protein